LGAVVTLADLDRAVATGADGRYVLSRVPAGPQHLTLRAIGYVPRMLHALVPQHGELRIDVSLRPLPFRLPAIEVRSPATLRGLEDDRGAGFPDRGISISAVRNHPLLSEPDVLQALGGGEIVLRPESPSGLHIRGGSSDQTAYLLDGIPVFSPYHTAGVFSAWNPDALARVDVASAAPPPAYPEALSGAVAAITRESGEALRVQGGVSTTQARLTLDGPLGRSGASYLASGRLGFPGVVAPKDEASYLRGRTGDWLAKVRARLGGGSVGLLAYASENDVDAAAALDTTSGDPRRNLFEWDSRSLALEWSRAYSVVSVRLLAWSAIGEAGSVWVAESSVTELASSRRDRGLMTRVERRRDADTLGLGLRLELSSTSYRARPDTLAGPPLDLVARTPVTALFAHYGRALARYAHLNAGITLSVAGGEVYPSPRLQLRWTPSQRLGLSASFARLRQFSQSLRNPESVVGSVFPADLFVVVGTPGVPAARSAQGVIALDYRPAAGARLGIQAYRRSFDEVVLVAPGESGPFATSGFAVGSGAARGIAVDAALAAARYGALASYALQLVRMESSAISYVPDHGATHLIEAGVIVFPTATTSVRVGATGALGRRATPLAGDFEWEACNLRDRGCEFVGSPRTALDQLGAASPDDYLRLDLGFRKHWHLPIGGGGTLLALHGTVTNVLGRGNVLTYVRDASTGALSPIAMRPFAPLVLGLDWRF
jgi:hypothetical protein